MAAVIRAPYAARPAEPFRLSEIVARFARWGRLRAERNALANLDQRLLRDIGLDPAEAAHEADRPFWDEPAGRW